MEKQTKVNFVDVGLGDSGGEKSAGKDDDNSGNTEFTSGARLMYGRGGERVDTNNSQNYAEIVDQEVRETVENANDNQMARSAGVATFGEDEEFQGGCSHNRAMGHAETRGTQEHINPFEDFSDDDTVTDEEMEDVCLEDLEDLEKRHEDDGGELVRPQSQYQQEAPESVESVAHMQPPQFSNYSFHNRSSTYASSSTPVYPPGLNIENRSRDSSLATSSYSERSSTRQDSTSPYEDDFIKINGHIVLPILTAEGVGEATLRAHKVLGKHRVKRHSRLRMSWIPIPKSLDRKF